MSKANISVIDPSDASGMLKRAYKRIGGSRGSIANVHQCQSLHPKAMLAHLDLYMAIMYEDSPLSRVQRELLGAAVSYFNDCEYCVIHHYEALKFNWAEAPPIDEIIAGVGLNEADLSLVSYAKELTLTISRVNDDTSLKLREVGFSDRAILDATLIIGYFNFVNRLVLGVGVQLEDQTDRNYKY